MGQLRSQIKGETYMIIDIERLRKDLIDYYGTAMNNGFPAVVIDLPKAEAASEHALITMAEEEEIDLNKYVRRTDDSPNDNWEGR